MLKRLMQMLRGQPPKPQLPTPTTIPADSSTFFDWPGHCPDCGAEKLFAGPSGGASQNILCKCGSEFNYVHWLGQAHRNSPPGGCSPARMRDIFGLNPLSP